MNSVSAVVPINDLSFLCFEVYIFYSFLRQSVQREVPQTSAGPVCAPGGPICGLNGVVHRTVHLQRL